MSDMDWVRCVPYMLRYDAFLWWDGAVHGVNLATLTWKHFKDIFYNKYFTADARRRLTQEFMSLRHENLTVPEFIRRFDRGCHFVPIIARGEAEKLRHFMDGLRTTIRRVVMLMRLATYDAATACAFQAEQALRDIDVEMQSKSHLAQQSSQPHNKHFTGPQEIRGNRIPKDSSRNQGSRNHRRLQVLPIHKRGNPTSNAIGSITVNACGGHLNALYATMSAIKPQTARGIRGLIQAWPMPCMQRREFCQVDGVIPETMDLGFRVSFPSDDQMFTSRIVKKLELHLQKNDVQADIIVLPMLEFDIILCMDWLSSNGASIDFDRGQYLFNRPTGSFSFSRQQGTCRCCTSFLVSVRENL
ncbi:uncharacterized protein LOC142532262 [Primulina tabacum]|uniref:uncharacterized protein LOC142532262 n=1 Tax=Primulina tabacum TaxID=48773 RepID=UPI003F5A7E43